ncbi:MAG: hypothetical protein HYU36_25050 [Planctomycetes bacterium]|nr:hypothetical protein [Planctomycetota bacterium]
MNEKSFNAWLSKARNECPPPVHVAGRVLQDIRGLPLERPSDRTLLFFTGLAAAAAVVVAALSFQAWVVLQDPLASFFCSLTLVMS